MSIWERVIQPGRYSGVSDMNGNDWLPLPTPGELPPGLRGLLSLLIREQERQKMYSQTPLSQKLWPDARLQYVQQFAPGLFVGGAMRYNFGQTPDFRLGVGGQFRF